MLSQSEWQYIEYTMASAFNKARPKPNEGKPSAEFLETEKRIMNFLQSKAYGKQE